MSATANTKWRVKRIRIGLGARFEWCAWSPLERTTATWFPTWREAFAYADAMARAEA